MGTQQQEIQAAATKAALMAAMEWGTPPIRVESDALTMAMIGEALELRPGTWAIVMRPDRWSRAESVVKRITDGREWGPGYEATIRKVGGQIRVYARKLEEN